MAKFASTQKKCLVLSVCVDWLEKDRQYEMASLLLTYLLLNQKG
jgi:hypothetical protein